MKRFITILCVLVVLQLGLGIFLFQNKKEYDTFHSEKFLVTFSADLVDQIVITDKDKQEVLLKKEEGGWKLPAHHDFSAQKTEVDRLLSTLSGLKKGWPVATSKGAAKRFKVGVDDFEQRIILSGSGKELARIYFGSSPGFKTVHARPGQSDEVVIVPFSTFEASIRPDDWIDKDVLQLDQTDIQSLSFAGMTIKRQEESFVLDGLGEDEEGVQEELERLVKQIAELRVETVLGPELKAEYNQNMPDVTLSLHLQNGEMRDYFFSKPTEQENYIVKVSDMPHYFETIGWQIEHIKELSRDSLVRKKEKDKKTEAVEAEEDTN